MDLGCVLGPQVGVLLQQAADEPDQLGGKVRAHQGQLRRRFVLMLLGELEGRPGGERRPPDQQFVQDAAERVEVGEGGDGFGPELLRGHVAGRADADARTGQPRLVGIVDDRAHAEVEDLEGAVTGQHHIGGLQVAVDDPGRVRGRESRGDLGSDGGGPGNRKLGLLVDEVRERMTVQQLHGQIGQTAAARRPVHAAVDQQGEVRMPLGEHAHDPHLAAETLDLLAGPGGVDGDPGPAAQHGLDGDLAVWGVRGGPEVLCPVHLAHVAASHDPRDPEPLVDRSQAHLPSPVPPVTCKTGTPCRERTPSLLKESINCLFTLSTHVRPRELASWAGTSFPVQESAFPPARGAEDLAAYTSQGVPAGPRNWPTRCAVVDRSSQPGGRHLARWRREPCYR